MASSSTIPREARGGAAGDHEHDASGPGRWLQGSTNTYSDRVREAVAGGHKHMVKSGSGRRCMAGAHEHITGGSGREAVAGRHGHIASRSGRRSRGGMNTS